LAFTCSAPDGNGVHVSLMLAAEDAHRLAAALIESALEVER
jgi:hypothetical protein